MGTNRKLLAVLFISLGLNIFIGGMLVGKHASSKGIHMKRPDFFKNHEDSDGKREIRKISRKIVKGAKKDILKIKMLKYNALKAIEKEPFDKEAINNALLELRNSLNEAQKNMHDNLIKTSENMPAEQRVSLLKMMCKNKVNTYRQYGDKMHKRGIRNGGDSMIHQRSNDMRMRPANRMEGRNIPPQFRPNMIEEQ